MLCTPEQAEVFTSGQLLAEDPDTAEWLHAASLAVQRYCGWWIAPVRSVTVTVEGTGTNRLVVPYPAVRDVAVRDMDSARYRLIGPTLLLNHGVWGAPFYELEIMAGYEPPEVADVAMVVARVADRMAEQRGGVTHRQVGSVSTTFAVAFAGDGLQAPDHDALEPYRIGPLP